MNIVPKKLEKNNPSKQRCNSQMNTKVTKKQQNQTAMPWEKTTNCRYWI